MSAVYGENNPGKRDNISGKVLSDGGRFMWDASNCHLEETSLKKYWAETKEGRKYLLRIRYPESLLHGSIEEEIK